MKIIDLTHYISDDIPVYPGTESPKFKTTNTYEKDGFRETLIEMYSHTGTHMDAPAHIYERGTTLDKFSIDKFMGKALLVDCSDLGEGDIIGLNYINKKLMEEVEFLLFYTGWDKYWGKDKYFGNYPYISQEVVDCIVKQNLKGIGLDTIGVDPINDQKLTIHKKIFEKNDMVIIENLMNLDKIGQDLFTFIALPLNHIDADGSPIRAVAVLKE